MEREALCLHNDIRFIYKYFKLKRIQEIQNQRNVDFARFWDVYIGETYAAN